MFVTNNEEFALYMLHAVNEGKEFAVIPSRIAKKNQRETHCDLALKINQLGFDYVQVATGYMKRNVHQGLTRLQEAFLIPAIDRDAAIELGRSHSQNRILHHDFRGLNVIDCESDEDIAILTGSLSEEAFAEDMERYFMEGFRALRVKTDDRSQYIDPEIAERMIKLQDEKQPREGLKLVVNAAPVVANLSLEVANI